MEARPYNYPWIVIVNAGTNALVYSVQDSGTTAMESQPIRSLPVKPERLQRGLSTLQ